VVLVDSAAPRFREWRRRLLPYLEHFGVPARVWDLARGVPSDEALDCGVIIAGHRGLRTGAERKVMSAVGAGAGMVSFDPGFPFGRGRGEPVRAESVSISAPRHYVSSRHESGNDIALLAPIMVPPLAGLDGTVLASAGGRPLAAVCRVGLGRLVRWASTDWMSHSVLGALGGLDHLVWRGIVWAARKPFVLRGRPPIVSMRGDAVAGRGGTWGRPALGWVGDCVEAGFKPWLGLFIYNLTREAVGELKSYLRRGQATAFPHAFGRRPIGCNCAFPYYERAPRFPVCGMDEFIFYDHERAEPWPDLEVGRRLRAVDSWYAAHGRFPKSRCFIPHWYETGENAVRHVVDRWGADFAGIVIEPGTSYIRSTQMLKAGPYRRHEAADHRRPVYYADFVEAGGRRLFNCLTEVRDVGGYEWAPDNDLPATIDRGVKQLRRALDSMVPAVLFTHETDYIRHMRPERFRHAVHAVARGVAGHAPEFLTLDDAARCVRATRTSRLESCRCVPGERHMLATLTGSADVATELRVFTGRDEGIRCRRVRVPPFRSGKVVGVDI